MKASELLYYTGAPTRLAGFKASTDFGRTAATYTGGFPCLLFALGLAPSAASRSIAAASPSSAASKSCPSRAARASALSGCPRDAWAW